MVIDFSKLNTTNTSNTLLEPRQIFSSLPQKNPRYSYLRDVQAQVMEKWFNRRNDPDLVLKMNTGSGKTLVGLLLLKSCLNEKKGPAVYIAPDKYLVNQVLQEAKDLGIETTESETSPSFLNSQSILVINPVKLFNGKSTFGVNEKKITVGSFLIDDAHSCLATIKEKFSIKMSNNEGVYDILLKLFDESLKVQSPTALLDIKDNDPSALLQVPYWTWKDKQDTVLRILHADKEKYKFEWPLIKDVLPFCNCYFSGTSVEISPRLLPIDVIPSFVNASRRIYMTATLADESVLITDFGAAPSSVALAITPNSGDDLGDRMILAPQELNPELSDDAIKGFIAEESKDKNVVVIVPSDKRAAYWANVSNQILKTDSLIEGIQKLKDGHVGLTVLVNRYDGIDLPADACRILVIDGLPEVRSLSEKIEQYILEGGDVFTKKQIQRIEQGMGRAVRSNDDYCVVLLLGAKLIQRIHDPIGKDAFTPATSAQIKLSQQLADQLKGKEINELSGAIKLCLERDTQWLSVAKGCLASIKPDEKSLADTNSENFYKAFMFARNQLFDKAVEQLQNSISKIKDKKLAAYITLQKAEYLHHISPVESQNALRAVILDNARITRPQAGVPFRKITSENKNQITRIQNYLSTFKLPNDFLIEVNAILSDLIFQEETSEEFEEAFYKLGTVLGYTSQRPEKEFGDGGPDNLWAVDKEAYFIIECKNGVKTKFVSKSDCNQISGSLNWFKERYGLSCKLCPILVHPYLNIHELASPDSRMRVMNVTLLDQFKKSIEGFSKAIVHDWDNVLNPEVLQKNINHFGLAYSKLVSTYTSVYKKI